MDGSLNAFDDGIARRQFPCIEPNIPAGSTQGRCDLIHLEPIALGVAQENLKKDAAAWGYRDAAWSMVIYGVDPDPATVPALKQWAQAYWAAVHPFNLPGAYANFMMDDEGEARVKAAYGGNYDRLATLKKNTTRTTSSM